LERFSGLITRIPAVWLAKIPDGRFGMGFARRSCSLS
jgi:hypothetical protein